jgi:hypothetical protein
MKAKTRIEATWKPPGPAPPGRLSAAGKSLLPDTAFAFPHARKEPMTDAAHVRDAMARFNQVGDVTDGEKDLAFANIHKAAAHFDIQMKETNWRHDWPTP